jgi:hypothetical protein
MRVSEIKSNSALGFLTVVDDPECGLFGGYLVLTPSGRPMEFHCTAPIRPNRAQQILYGPTLEPYLFGEQIGRALVAAAKAEPLAVFTDREPALALRQFVELPVVLVLPETAGPTPGSDGHGDSPASDSASARIVRLDPPHAISSRTVHFQLGRNRLAVPVANGDDRQVVTARIGELAESLDLAEPFERIREAIEEARRSG